MRFACFYHSLVSDWNHGDAHFLRGAGDRVAPELRLLADASALAFSAVDLGYVAARRISPIYLADAAVELGLVAARRRVP